MQVKKQQLELEQQTGSKSKKEYVKAVYLELVGPCVVLGFSVSMEAFDELLSINVPWSQEFPGVRVWT